MKSNSNRSSLKSARITDNDDENKLMDFEDYVYIACKKFNIPCRVVVNKEIQNDNFLRSIRQESKQGKKSIKSIPVVNTRPSFILMADKNEDSIISTPPQDEDLLLISAIYDAQNKLVEITLYDAKLVPRELVQLIGLILPRFPFLTRISIKKCRINKYIIYEISKYFQFTSVTDICLDGSSFREADFAFLLQNTRISNLSLSRCRINDVVCETIATQLHYMQPIQCRLTTLNLSINRITDVGAKYLGLALRSNRYLRYLNLAGNCITDDGANHILKSLMYFPLTGEETKAVHSMYAEYLKEKNAKSRLGMKPRFYEKCHDDTVIDSKPVKATETPVTKNKKKSKGKASPKVNKDKSYSSAIDVTAVSTSDTMIFSQVPSFVHPFSPANMENVDGFQCCKGNMVLCYLNLAYNNISYLTLKKFIEVLRYQSETKESSEYGLLKVVIEGNDLPNACLEMEIINDYLKRNIMDMAMKQKVEVKGGKYKRKSVTSATLSK